MFTQFMRCNLRKIALFAWMTLASGVCIALLTARIASGGDSDAGGYWHH